jgi:hypothetical protein
MLGVYSIIIGVVIVAIALFLLRREFMRAYFIGGPTKNTSLKSSSSDEVVLYALNDVEEAMKEMSEAFYDITGDLEGNYSVHDKELQLLTDRVVSLENALVLKERELKDLRERVNQVQVTSLQKQDILVDTMVIEEEDGPPKIEDVKEPINHGHQEHDQSAMIMSGDEDIKGKIIEMRSQGYSLRQIAKTLDIGLGEIQLILNMKRS